MLTGAAAMSYLTKDAPGPTAGRAKAEAERLEKKAATLSAKGAGKLSQEALTEAAKQRQIAMINMPEKYSEEQFEKHEAWMNTLLEVEKGEKILTEREKALENPAAAADYLANVKARTSQEERLKARQELLKGRPWLGGEE